MADQEKKIVDTMRGLGALDALLQHRSRLGACVLLSTADAMSFSRLKSLLKETDGNLGAQMRKLEEANYLHARKTFENRKPITWYSLTSDGRKALKAHLGAMQQLIQQGQG